MVPANPSRDENLKLIEFIYKRWPVGTATHLVTANKANNIPRTDHSAPIPAVNWDPILAYLRLDLSSSRRDPSKEERGRASTF
ncbi:hypothetical protein Ddc_00408 [Ditylenchus destructor]|nr:hypothetical protein Ddc_00408 [Ditylenchus destructor]